MLLLKKIIWSVLLFTVCISIQAQTDLFSTVTDANPTAARIANFQLSDESLKRYEQYKNSPLVSKLILVEINAEALKNPTLFINYGSKKSMATRSKLEERATNNFSWFGKLEDETGTFFTTMNGMVVSKFYLGSVPYTLIPLQGKTHMLIEYAPDKNIGYCPTGTSTTPSFAAKKDGAANADASAALAAPLPNDNNCNVRVLIAVTATAEAELGMNLDLVAQMLADESNLAYQQSLINFRMEIARVMRTTYTETNTFTGDFADDVINFRNGASPLNAVHAMRDVYQSDVQVLLRRGSFFVNGGQLFGQAYEIPLGSANPDPANAFCFIVTDYIIGGRFTFAHEIGHLQGARHDNHNATPVYARGFILNTTSGSIRDIMSTSNVVGCGTVNNGCRVQLFSNPNVTFNGNAMGTADRDNVRRMNELSAAFRNNRRTTENLVVQNETFDNEVLANHLANSTISTSGSVIALAGSRVTMRATDEIVLNNGFEVQAGSNFAAVLSSSSPCSNQPPATRVAGSDMVTGKENTDASESTGFDGRSKISVYPNPVDNVISLRLSGLKSITGLTYVITDLMGRVILKGIISGTISNIKSDQLQPGSYLLTVYEKGKLVETKKVIKQNK